MNLAIMGTMAGAKSKSYSQWSDYIESLSPWAWWSLADADFYGKGDSVAEDLSGNGRTAVFNGDTTAPLRWSDSLTSQPGYGISLSSINQFQLRSSILTDLTVGSFTFGFWLKGTDTGSYLAVISGGNYFRVGLNFDWVSASNVDGAISWLASTVGADSDALTASVGWNDGNPHFVMFEYDSVADTVSIWFDGVKEATRSHAGVVMPTTHTNASMIHTGSLSTDWEFDEYVFFDRPLTSDEHTTLASYNGPAVHPYSLAWSPPYNAPSHLDIPVPGLASTEAMHPDVLDMGAEWNGYRYWMAFTPYNGDANTEVPCIVATNDIVNDAWVVPAGYANPIAVDPPGSDHYADTDLVYDSSTDRLYVFAVRDDGSTFQDIRSWWTSGDGTWSSEVTVLAGAAGTYGNPAMVSVPGGWRIYYTIGNSGLQQLRYRESNTAPDSGYGTETVCTGIDVLHFQNLNMVRDVDGSLVAIVSDALSIAGDGGRLFFARSSDNGQSFQLTGEPVLKPGAGWDQSGIYRTSVLTDADGVVQIDGNGLLDVWYSAYTTGIPAQWGTAHIKLPPAVLRGVAA